MDSFWSALLDNGTALPEIEQKSKSSENRVLARIRRFKAENRVLAWIRRFKADHNAHWKKGIRDDFLWTVGILIVHIAFVIWGHFYYQASTSFWESFGFRVLAAATDCITLSRLRTGLSFMFNMLAAIIPIFSSNTMLALSSPTRRQLNCCHTAGQYMDIGAHSFSNIRKRWIPWPQKIVWMLLVLLALPNHFL